MKFEKLSENKIRITLSIQDLAEKEIDFHVFMSNSIESQDILLDMLEQAKKETGFDPENYNLKIEALAMADTSFVFTITKEVPEEKTKLPKKKFTIKRKSLNPSSTQAVYAFSNFDDYCSFLHFLQESNLLNDIVHIADSILLYQYKEKYYLLMNGIHNEVVNKLRFYTAITEFAKYITNSKVFVSKLLECGNLIMKDNALEVGLKHFC
ncbi:MAG: adaptor protein MecA [Clostridia bacterium]|nr:adaptor protein MecA [Clostridia bacterium]